MKSHIVCGVCPFVGTTSIIGPFTPTLALDLWAVNGFGLIFVKPSIPLHHCCVSRGFRSSCLAEVYVMNQGFVFQFSQARVLFQYTGLDPYAKD